MIPAVSAGAPAQGDAPDTDQIGDQLEEIVSGTSGLGWQDWVLAGAIVAVSVAIGLVVRRLASRLITRGGREGLVARSVSRFAAGIVIGFGVVYALGTLGVTIGPLLGVLGVGGIALAFALQNILENVAAGVIIQARRPFGLGDEIRSDGFEGSVEDVNLRAVIMRTFDGRKVLIPTSTVLRNAVEVDTDRPSRRTCLVVGVAYRTDLEEARAVLEDAVRAADGVLPAPEPQVYVEEFGDSSINFALLYWHRPQRREMWRVRDEVARSVKRAFDEHGIEIPFPQRVLWRGDGGQVAGEPPE